MIILANAVPDEITSQPNGAEPSESDGASPEQAPAQTEAEQQAEVAGAEEQQPDPLEEAKAESARLRDQLLRVAADFDNFRKRSRRELADAEKRSRDDFLRELLPVFDNLERAAAVAESSTEVKALADGIALVMKQFYDTLGKLGVERIQAVGTAFDPAIHEAVQQIETTEQSPGSVVSEIQAGYRAGERLIRPSLVVVAKAPPN